MSARLTPTVQRRLAAQAAARKIAARLARMEREQATYSARTGFDTLILRYRCFCQAEKARRG